MKHNSRLIPAALCLLLAAMLACGSPFGFLSRTTPTPSPIAEAPEATEAATAKANATATRTPRPTGTEEAEASGTPATPEPLGVTLESLPGGGTRVVDGDGGYELQLPARWVAVHLGEDDVNSALDIAATQYPEQADLFKAFTASSAEARLFAFSINPAQVRNDLTPTIIVALDTRSVGIALDLLVQSTATLLPQTVEGAKILGTNTGESASGVQLGIIEATLPATVDDGEVVTMYEKIVIFKTVTASVLLTLAVPQDLQADVEPAFDSVTDSIVLIEN